MRFLTRAWHAGELSDEEADALLAAFHAHRATVLSQLPASVRAFAETVNVHDGRLRAVRLERPAGTLHVALRCGDAQVGYFDLDLMYAGVRVDRLDVPVLEVVARDPRGEALCLEEDVIESGWYVHRWLWWPFGRELDIEFSDLTFSLAARPDREFDRAGEPFTDTGRVAPAG